MDNSSALHSAVWFGQVIHKLYLFIQQLGTQIGADWREERGVTNVIGEGKYFSFYQKIFRYFVYLALILWVSLTGWEKFYHHQSQSVTSIQRREGSQTATLHLIRKEGLQLVEKYKSGLTDICTVQCTHF